MVARKPLCSRPLDLVYFVFFLIHIPGTIVLDCQAIYPAWAISAPLLALRQSYIEFSSDPLIIGSFNSNSNEFLWFKSFLFVEASFQLPVFFIGAYKLWKDSPSVYPLLLFYGASTATTVLPCLATLFATPITSAETMAAGVPPFTSFQQLLLLSSYFPFLLIPLMMAVDMAFRLSKFVQAGTLAAAKKKAT